MYLELESVCNNPGESLPFAFTLQSGLCPPTPVKGEVRNRAGIVTMEATADYRLETQCDRCAEPMVYRAEVPIAHTLVTTRESEESDELILLEQFRFCPDNLIWEDIVLSLPPKFLCRPDCKGLCPQCGANQNEAPCACQPEGDPRLAALRQLLESSEDLNV